MRLKNNMIRKAVIMLLCFSLLAVGGCSNKPAATTEPESTEVTNETTSKEETTEGTTTEAAKEGMRTITNIDNTTVEIPAEVTGVAPTIGAFGHITAMLGGSDRIVASIKNFSSLFRSVWPDTNPEGYETGNIEDIIASGAQVTYGPNYTDEQREQLETAGIVVLQVDAFSNADEMKAIVRLIGDILGEDAPERAEAFCEYYDQNIAYVKEKTADLTDDEKVKVLNLRYSGDSYTTVKGTDISAFYAESAGGIFVSGDFEGAAGGDMTVNAEQIIEWEPDVIFTMGREAKERIMSDAALSSVPAVANDKVFVEPSGTYPWSVRSAEGALMPLFLAKIMYPELFADLVVEDETRDFYQEMYSYTLTDEELETIMAGSE